MTLENEQRTEEETTNHTNNVLAFRLEHAIWVFGPEFPLDQTVLAGRLFPWLSFP